MYRYKLIDLFAGAGGLSLGFKETGRFDFKAFVEKNENAKNTYQHNFPHSEWYSDVRGLDYKKINADLGGIDVVIGGPPCQGFSNANRQHNQAINLNNKLVKQYIRAIIELQPKAFVMENVSMLRSNVHRFFIEESDAEIIEKYKIATKGSFIFLLDHNLVFDGAEELVEDYKMVLHAKWSSRLYLLLNIWLKDSANGDKLNSAIDRHVKEIKDLIAKQVPVGIEAIDDANRKLFDFISENEVPELKERKTELTELLNKPIAFQKMLMWAQEIHENNIVIARYYSEKDDINANGDLGGEAQSCAVYDYLTGILGSDQSGYTIESGVLLAEQFGVPQKRRRYVLMGVKKEYADKVDLPAPKDGTPETTVYEAIYDLEYDTPFTSIADDKYGTFIGHTLDEKAGYLKSLRDSNNTVYNHIGPETTPEAKERFKHIRQGENFHVLPPELKTNTYTNAERTQNTIYKRLKYDEPSGTVINVRKSMWIHPTKDRAISVREAARLQTFPDSFRFYGPKDSEYQQVGNAVPPMLAKAIAEQILKYIDKDNG